MAPTWAPITRVLPPGDAISLSVGPDGHRLVVCLSDGSVEVADSTTYRVLNHERINGTYRAVAAVAVAVDLITAVCALPSTPTPKIHSVRVSAGGSR